MKRLYATTDPTEAEGLRTLLRDAGIESTLDEGLGINVSNEDAPKAAEVLAAHFEKQDAPATLPRPDEDAGVPTNRLMRRALALGVVLLPAGFCAVMFAVNGDWERALMIAGAVGGMVALVWVVNEWTEKKDGSAPR